MSNLLPIYSGNIDDVTPLHQYDVNDIRHDVLLLRTNGNQLTYIVINRSNDTIVKRSSLPYSTKVLSILQEEVSSNFEYSIMQLDKTMGFIRNVSISNYVTLFLIIKHKLNNDKYIFQINIRNHNIANATLQLIDKFIGVPNEYIEVMIKKNVIFTDTVSVEDIQTHIMYIDSELSIRNTNNIKGLRVMVSNAEKEEYATLHNLEEPLDTTFPVVDTLTTKHFIYMQLPEGTTKAKFNFSTGMGFVNLS